MAVAAPATSDSNAPVGTSILVVVAHPDDIAMWAGGVIAQHAATGRAAVAAATNGAERDAEAVTCALAFGADLHVLDRIDVAHPIDIIGKTAPDVLITHRVDDGHPDHRSVAAEVLIAVSHTYIGQSLPRRLYTCDTFNSLGLRGAVRHHNRRCVRDLDHEDERARGPHPAISSPRWRCWFSPSRCA
jgi:LmbE family N-acetylglucosaminyl deacetylase